MSKTYNEPGKAKKQCPSCSLYVHARTLECPNCHHSFGTPKATKLPEKIREPKEPVAKKEPTVYTEGGKGRKECPKCKIYVAARLETCPKCNNVIPKPDPFPVKDKEKVVKPTKPTLPEDTNRKYVGKLIFAPVGEAPYDPDEDVEGWCARVFADGLKNGLTYSNQALWYWYQRFNNDSKSRDRIWEWSKREGFDKMQEHRQEPVSSSETETDSFQLSGEEE